MRWKNIFNSPYWFLLGGIIFLSGSIRYYITQDTTGSIIYLVTAILFFIGFWGQKKFNKPKR